MVGLLQKTSFCRLVLFLLTFYTAVVLDVSCDVMLSV